VGALSIPPEAIPRSERQLRTRLRRAFKNLGYEVPKDLARWGTERMRAVWCRLIEERHKRKGGR